MVLNYIDHTHPSTWKPGKEVEEMRAVYEGWDPRYARHQPHAWSAMGFQKPNEIVESQKCSK